ncbi:hypothetical protein PQG46_03305 [Aquirufa nivalisilvae]
MKPRDQFSKKECKEGESFISCIGNMYGHSGVLRQYQNAVNILFDNIKDHNVAADSISYPIMYMMRHSFELGYKSNLDYFEEFGVSCNSNELKNHNLNILHTLFLEKLDQINTKTPFDVEKYEKFKKVDTKTSQLLEFLEPLKNSAYRYVKSLDGTLVLAPNKSIDLNYVKCLFDEAIEMFFETSNLISPLAKIIISNDD